MNEAVDLEEEAFRATKYPKLRVLTGGKGPSEPPKDSGENWLFPLEVGTVFACRQGDKTVDWEEYYLMSKIDDNLFLLKMSVPDGKIWDRRVDPKLFCNHHRDYVVLWVHKQQQEQEITNDPEQCNPD